MDARAKGLDPSPAPQGSQQAHRPVLPVGLDHPHPKAGAPSPVSSSQQRVMIPQNPPLA
jgi:hypothetical protein